MNRTIKINNKNQVVRFVGYQDLVYQNLLFRKVMCDKYLVPRTEWVPIPIESYYIQIIQKAIARNPEILKSLREEVIAKNRVRVVTLEKRYDLSWLNPPQPKMAITIKPAPKVKAAISKMPAVKEKAAEKSQKKQSKPKKNRKYKPYVRKNSEGDQMLDALDYRLPGSYGTGRR